MSEKIIIAEFINFLKDNSCYIQYRENISKNIYGGIITPLGFVYGFKEQILPRANSFDYGIVTNFINYAFTWCKTKQGHEFWGHLDIKWRELVKDKQLYVR
jgi:hypothetical protein